MCLQAHAPFAVALFFAHDHRKRPTATGADFNYTLQRGAHDMQQVLVEKWLARRRNKADRSARRSGLGSVRTST